MPRTFNIYDLHIKIQYKSNLTHLKMKYVNDCYVSLLIGILAPLIFAEKEEEKTQIQLNYTVCIWMTSDKNKTTLICGYTLRN